MLQLGWFTSTKNRRFTEMVALRAHGALPRRRLLEENRTSGTLVADAGEPMGNVRPCAADYELAAARTTHAIMEVASPLTMPALRGSR